MNIQQNELHKACSVVQFSCTLSDIIKWAVKLSINEEIEEEMYEICGRKKNSNPSCLNKAVRKIKKTATVSRNGKNPLLVS